MPFTALVNNIITRLPPPPKVKTTTNETNFANLPLLTVPFVMTKIRFVKTAAGLVTVNTIAQKQETSLQTSSAVCVEVQATWHATVR
jgi:hypothetical protein